MFVSKSQNDYVGISNYFFRTESGYRFGVNIAHTGGKLFQIPEVAQYDAKVEGMLHNATFLWLFIIRKLLQTRNTDTVALNTPIIIETIDNSELTETINLTDASSNYRQVDIMELLGDTGAELRESLQEFGITFVETISDGIVPVKPLLAFDIYDGTELSNGNSPEIIISHYLADEIAAEKYVSNISRFADGNPISSRKDLKDIKYTYLFAAGGLTSRNVIETNRVATDYNICLVNAITPSQADDTDKEHKSDIVTVTNQTSNGLLKHIGTSREHNEPFTDLIKLYSFLERIDDEICISYNDFAEARNGRLTDNQLRALALFHLQNPEKVLDFEDLQSVKRTDFCKYVANLADRVEGTVSDRLITLHSKQLGKLYTIQSKTNCNMMAVLEDIQISKDNCLNILAVDVDTLASNIDYHENRITLKDVGDKTHMQALPYGEDPYDFRPDFVINPLCSDPDTFTFRCDGTDIVCADDTVEIVPVLDTLLSTGVLDAIVHAELLDYSDYSFSPRTNIQVEDGHAVISSVLQTEVVTRYDWSSDESKNISPLSVGRSLQEKVFIAQSFVHRLLRYFESFINTKEMSIKGRLLSLADLVCFRYKGKLYFGISELFTPHYIVKPLLTSLDIRNEKRRYSYTETTDLSKCVFALNPVDVTCVTPTSVFNVTEKLPLAIQAIVTWLNKQNNTQLEYKDYVSFGLKFDEWSEFLLLHSCSSAGNLETDNDSLFACSSDEFATLLTGCNNAIKAAYLEYKLGYLTEEQYMNTTADISRLYMRSFMFIPLYSLSYMTEREAIKSSDELLSIIDFTFFKNVRMQYSPITIFGNWNRSGNAVTWHTTLLKN